jgi:hypothetical protein
MMLPKNMNLHASPRFFVSDRDVINNAGKCLKCFGPNVKKDENAQMEKTRSRFEKPYVLIRLRPTGLRDREVGSGKWYTERGRRIRGRSYENMTIRSGALGQLHDETASHIHEREWT